MYKTRDNNQEKMTIKIQAYQAGGIKTDRLVDEFEFCCWESLHQWLHNYSELHKCLDCRKFDNKDLGGKNYEKR